MVVAGRGNKGVCFCPLFSLYLPFVDELYGLAEEKIQIVEER